MIDLHPITPPPELVRKWNDDAIGTQFPPYGYSEYIATQAANWGANQELDACVKWLIENHYAETPVNLLRARRAKPPSLAEQALSDLDVLLGIAKREGVFNPPDTIRAALKRLQELENNG